MKRIVLALGFFAALGVTSAASAAEPTFWFGGAVPSDPANGVYLHLEGKPGDGGRLTTFRTNITLTCGADEYTSAFGGELTDSSVIIRRGEARFEFYENDDVFIPGIRGNVGIKFCGASGLPSCFRTENGRRVRVKKFKKALVVVGLVSDGEECTAYKTFKVRLGVAE